MNEHARSIYQAALDGKTVQRSSTLFYERIEDDNWIDDNPFECVGSVQPQNRPNIWRIKPKYKFEKMFSRAYLDKEVNAAVIYHFTSDESLTELRNMKFFGGWLSDWLVYEVEVEDE